VVAVAGNPSGALPRPLHYGEDIEAAAAKVLAAVAARNPELPERYPARWLAFKLMEGDRRFLEETGAAGLAPAVENAVGHLLRAHGEDIESLMADARYARAAGLTREVVRKPEVEKRELAEKIDRVVLNRFLGIPVFLAAMWLVFKLTFDVSTPFVDWIDGVTAGPLTRWTAALIGFLRGPEWIASLNTDGIIGGVGFVLVFIPAIFAMMFFITFLEGSGYMARAAFVMDRAMHGMGLHGKSFIPMLLGFGCNVPAIYATRTLENPRDKALTALLIPRTGRRAVVPPVGDREDVYPPVRLRLHGLRSSLHDVRGGGHRLQARVRHHRPFRFVNEVVTFHAHPVEPCGQGPIALAECGRAEFDGRLVLVFPLRAISKREHQSPACPQHGMIGNRVGPLLVHIDGRLGRNKIFFRTTQIGDDLLRACGNPFDESLGLKSFQGVFHRRSA
jgi:hypothetical protein